MTTTQTYTNTHRHTAPYVTKRIRDTDGVYDYTGPYAVANKNVLSLHLKQLKVVADRQ